MDEDFNVFMVGLDGDHLDAVFNVGSLEKQIAWGVLVGKSEGLYKELHEAIRHMLDRARTPFYSIYTLQVTLDTMESEFIEMFNSDPVASIKLIRDYGNIIHV